MEAENETRFNEMQQVKRHLFAMRNGIVADTLRKAGSPFRIIFGVNLPQLVEIASATGKNTRLARQLWANDSTRESMLLAPMLMPADDMGEAEAREWVRQVPDIEVADILTHRLLRRQPYALALARELCQADDYLQRYCGLRLMCHLGNAHPDEAYAAGEAEEARRDPRTRIIASQLKDYRY